MKCKACGNDQDRMTYSSVIDGEVYEEILCAPCRNKVRLAEHEDNWHNYDKGRYATSLGVD